ncbi:MAG TPA: NfeD family protein [Phycisphaerales bacterium]|nr:NfeD family protein [Phycisphaerales bacterium]
MDPLLVWALGFVGLAVVLMVMEVFLPTAGTLAIASAVSALVAVVLFYRFDTTWGHVSLLSMLVLAPVAAGFMIKVWPHTPLGRKIIGAPSEDEVEQSRIAEETERRARQALVGKEGKVLRDLRPVGLVEIEGQRYEVLSETTFVPVGETVRVTQADLAQIKVRRV